jgi:hypothetical protein
MLDFENLLLQAKQALKSVKVNQIFKLRDLFEGYEWESFVKGDRLKFGGYFKRAVQSGKIDGVIYFGKASNNSAQYQKIEEVER